MTPSPLDTRVQKRISDGIRSRFANSVSFEVSQVQTDPAAAYNLSTGTVDEGTPTSYSVRCSPVHGVSKRFLSGTVVESDSQVVIPALGLLFTPSVGQTVTIGSEAWACVGLERYDADTEAAAWAVILRR